MKIGIAVTGILCCLLMTFGARAQVGQVEFRTPGNDSVKVVDILSDDQYHFQQVDSTHSFTTLVGHVAVRQEKTTIYCDSMIMYPHENYIECFKNVHVNDNDSVNIWSDYMKYQVDTRLVYFNNNVKLTDGKGILTTQALDYDLNQKIGNYVNGGKIVNKESVLTSDQGTYYENTKDIHFHKNVVLRDPQYDLSADSLVYNTGTQISTFVTETFIQFKDSSQRTVRTRSGYYDLKNRQAVFGKRPVMSEGSQRLTGDSVHVDDSTGLATAVGNAIYIDTTQGIKLLAGFMINNKKKNTFLATMRPLMAIKQDKDSLYITADTLMSARLVDFEVMQKKLAHDDSLHRIYVDSIEKVSADSLHNVALTKALRDSLARASGDTTMNEQIKDLSDSLGPGVADSLGRIGLDSLHRQRGNAGNINASPRQVTRIMDSVGRKIITSADSAALVGPPSPKELRRQQKAK
jgi:lipopolysaccharide export system protein LptA